MVPEQLSSCLVPTGLVAYAIPGFYEAFEWKKMIGQQLILSKVVEQLHYHHE